MPQIVAVNKVTSNAGIYPHRHISEVKTAGGEVLKRSVVVERILKKTQSFYTYVNGLPSIGDRRQMSDLFGH